MDGMTDEELLALYRKRDSYITYITLDRAKELHRVTMKFRHLGAAKEKPAAIEAAGLRDDLLAVDRVGNGRFRMPKAKVFGSWQAAAQLLFSLSRLAGSS